jgi:TRAP-type C4-dicarboxylate transport system substrate-binding protein
MITFSKGRSFAVAILAILASGVASAASINIATIAPEASAWMKEMRAGAAEIAERTDDRVKIKIIGGGIMGNDKKVLGAIRIGRLHGGALTPSALSERYPDINLYGMPMVFRDHDEARYVRSRLDERLHNGLLDAGFETFGFATGGFAILMSNTPVDSLADMKGKRVWVLEGDSISYASMEAMSLTPVTLPLTDVLTGLQTGLVDIVAVPPLPALVLQWHTKIKYITEIPLAYSVAFMAIDKRVFNKLDAGDQDVVREVMMRVYENFDRQNVLDNSEARDALLGAGIESVPFDVAEYERIRSVMQESNRELGDQGEVDLELYDEMIAYLEEYRSENP